MCIRDSCVTLASVFSCKTDLDEPVEPNNGNEDPNNGNTELVVSAVIADWTSVKTMTDGTGGGGNPVSYTHLYQGYCGNGLHSGLCEQGCQQPAIKRLQVYT